MWFRPTEHTPITFSFLAASRVSPAIAENLGKYMEVDTKILPTQEELAGMIGDYEVLIMRVDPLWYNKALTKKGGHFCELSTSEIFPHGGRGAEHHTGGGAAVHSQTIVATLDKKVLPKYKKMWHNIEQRIVW